MIFSGRTGTHTRATTYLVVTLVLAAWGSRAAEGQPPFGFLGVSTKFQLSGSITVDRADAETENRLRIFQAFVDNAQWSDAIETLRRVMEADQGKVIAVSPSRFTSLRDHVHQRLAELPAEALQIYRRQVDPLAKPWFEDAFARRDRDALARLVEQHFCSSWGDDALLALGELALEDGNYGTARGYWEQIIPPKSRPDGGESWLVYPDTDIPRADVFARRVLVSILEGSRDQATAELAAFTQEFPNARGRMGGREVVYAEMLAALAEEQPRWRGPAASGEWHTFAGNMQRNGAAVGDVEIGSVSWRRPIPKAPSVDPVAGSAALRMRRVGETAQRPLSYHPVVVGGRFFVSTRTHVYAFNVADGGPGWDGDGGVQLDIGMGYPVHGRSGTIGAARFTLTAHGDRLFARMGNPVTNAVDDVPTDVESGYLVAMEISTGRLLWDSRHTTALERGWSWEGSPACDGPNLYVGMRRHGSSPQTHVACLDAATGKLRWRQFVASASTPAQGERDEITHNLVTLHGGAVYYNTNVGAVAALDAEDGHLRWVSLYPRAQGGDLQSRAFHFDRDLNPCVYDRGKLYVAPSDSAYILAYDAHSGRELWRSAHAEDAIYLLGVAHNSLIAQGDRVWWFDTMPRHAFGELPGDRGGLALGWFPEGDGPRGQGRGIISSGAVYWPTANRIHQLSGGAPHEIRQPIDLESAPRDPRGGQAAVRGGNLVVAEGHLFIVTAPPQLPYDEVIAFKLVGGAGSRDMASSRASVFSSTNPAR